MFQHSHTGVVALAPVVLDVEGVVEVTHEVQLGQPVPPEPVQLALQSAGLRDYYLKYGILTVRSPPC